MADLECIIKLTRSIDDLVRNRQSFNFLEQVKPVISRAIEWRRGRVVSSDIQIIAIGKSGYGKSTTLNSLIGENAFQTDDNIGCTRVMQSAEYKFDLADNCYFSFADLPGLGENPDRDKEYFPLYRNAIAQAHVVIYFLRADQRDYSIDELAFSELFAGSKDKTKVLIALNAVDKVEPLNRSLPFFLTDKQLENIDIKINKICKTFSVAGDNVVPFSALEDFNMDLLVEKIEKRLKPYLENTFDADDLLLKARGLLDRLSSVEG